MPDSRFFQSLGPLTVAEISAAAGAALHSDVDAGQAILAVAPLVRAGPSDVAFFSDRRYLNDLISTRAGAVFVTAAQASSAPPGCAVLITPEPQAAYARASDLLHRALRHDPGSPAIHPGSEIESGVALAPGVVVGQGARIGSGTEIGANAVIGPGVCIGRHCRIGANVTIGFALIGDRVRIYANAVIGEEGFGVTGSRTGSLDIPQLGRVIIQDAVTIGAGSCIDRGAWDDTVIGEQTKIDNLVQVAHNVQLGRNCIIAAQTGLSGSVVVGDGVMFGGQVGIADHLTIGSGARLAASAGVMKNIPPGETWAGMPARPIRRFMREMAWLGRQAVKKSDGEA